MKPADRAGGQLGLTPPTLKLAVALLFLAACTPAAKEDGLTVVSFEPQGLVQSTRAIDVKLSRSEEGLTIAIDPPLEGQQRWLSQDTLQFVPKTPFAPSTRYRVTVAGKKFEFHTPMFGLASVEAFYEVVPGSPAMTIAKVNVELTHPVKPEAARAAIEFFDREQPVAAVLDSSSENTVMAFSLAPMPSEAELSLRIDGALAAAAGGEPLGKSVVRSLRATESAPLMVESLAPSQYGTELALQVRFTTDVDAASFERTLVVSPQVALRFGETYHGAVAYGPFKPRTKYTFTLKRGLTARTGQALLEDVQQTIEMPDLAPVVRFPDRGMVLLRSGHRQIAVETTNVKRLAVTATKVFENNLVHVVSRLEGGLPSETMGKQVFGAELEVADRPNEAVRTTIAFDDFSASGRRGLYLVEVRDAERWWTEAQKWALSTDLGITAKLGPEHARIQVLSLARLEPIAGAELELLSKTNATMAKLVTDSRGTAVARGRFEEPVTLVIARHGGDVSYLPIEGTELPTSDFEVGGAQETSAAYEAYAYTDRGTYRPGDTVHLTALLRDRSLKTPPSFPFQIELRDPRWRTFRILKGTAAIDGARAFDVSIPRDAPTGGWTARIMGAGDVLGEASFSVEETIPDRIAVDVEAVPKEPVHFRVEAEYLFGPPAAGLDVELSCRFEEQAFSAADYASFTFSGREEPALAENVELGRVQLDAEGEIERACERSGHMIAFGPVRVSLRANVFEKGGRSVSGAAGATLHPLPHYVGLRRNSESYHADQGSDAALEVVVVGPEGKPIAGVPVTAKVYEIEWRTILKLIDGRYRYVGNQVETPVDQLAATSASQPVALAYQPKRVGRHRVEATTAQGAKSSFFFYASGEGSAGSPASHPDRLAMAPDRASYEVGQTAKVMVRAPFSDGKLLLTVERDRVIWQSVVDMKGDTAAIEVPIGEAMSPNAYLVAQLVRRPDAAEADAPMRAFGVAPLAVESQRHVLNVELEAPAELRPREKLQIRLRASPRAHFTVAAVDEGLLQVDHFADPDPFSFFTRKRRLGLTTHDLYGMILPEQEAAAKKPNASGGDAFRARYLDPFSGRRVNPVALWSGIVIADSTGVATVELEVPELSGALRVMAVGFAGDRFGSTSKKVRVSDPVVVIPALPRFAGTLDRFRMPVQLLNTTSSPVQVALTVTTEGSLRTEGAAQASVSIGAGATGLAAFDLVAGEVPGSAKVVVKASSAGEESSVTTELPIRPSGSTVSYVEHQIARPGRTASFKLPGGFIPSSIEARLELGANPAFRFGESLDWLLQYPHGCVEQTAARAFPLLVLPDLGRVVGKELAPGESVRDHFVSAGVGRVLGMMMPSGGLSYWPGQSWGHPWTTVFGAHFLVEAQRTGFAVDAGAMEKILAHLGSIGAGTVAGEYREAIDFRTRAYALYVLALAGRKNASGLHYLADRFERALVEEDAEVPLDNEVRLLLAGGLAHAGLWDRANQILGKELAATAGSTRRGFFSSARADALALSILADSWPEHQSIPTLLDVLGNRAADGRWSTTQENAFALLAIGKIGRIQRKAAGDKSFAGQVTIDGNVARAFTSPTAFALTSSGSEWAGKTIEVKLTGARAYLAFRVSGIKADTLPPAAADGLDVERRFLSVDGAPIAGAVERGALVITELTVRAPQGVTVPNVAVIDLLPAGLEVENPRLVEGPHGLDWLKDATPADYADVRDDRVVFYTELAPGQSRKFFYASRAVTAGKYTLPHAQAEAMYDPSIRALAGGGTFEVR